MNTEAKVRTGMSAHARILIAIAVCAAMVLAIFGTSKVFAAGDDGSVADDAIRIEATGDFEGSSLSVRTSDAGIEYSVDGGKTWTSEVPEGVTVDDSGVSGDIADESGFSAGKGI
jgi:hypothetical protein